MARRPKPIGHLVEIVFKEVLNPLSVLVGKRSRLIKGRFAFAVDEVMDRPIDGTRPRFQTFDQLIQVRSHSLDCNQEVPLSSLRHANVQGIHHFFRH
jgi:hypothetical protein